MAAEFVEKAFADGPKTSKFAKVFSLESFGRHIQNDIASVCDGGVSFKRGSTVKINVRLTLHTKLHTKIIG